MIEQFEYIAFNLFREWTKNAKLDFPNNDFTIVDESIIVRDVNDSLSSSLKCLVKEEKIESRKKEGYDFGFIIGFLQGNLNVHWHNEYIVKRTDKYKEFVIIKAILSYLKFDELAGIRINATFESLLKEDLNLYTYDYDISEKKFDKYGIDDIEDEYNFNNNSVITYLENRSKEQIIEIVDIKEPNYLSNIEYIIEKDIINDLITNYESNKQEDSK